LHSVVDDESDFFFFIIAKIDSLLSRLKLERGKTRASGFATVRSESKVQVRHHVVSGCSTASYTPRMTYDRRSLQPTRKRKGQNVQNNTSPMRKLKNKERGRGGGISHLKDPICLKGVNPQTRILPTPNNIPPIPNRARARPQRRVRPEYGAERRRRL
jgi:hypothetical protein